MSEIQGGRWRIWRVGGSIHAMEESYQQADGETILRVLLDK